MQSSTEETRKKVFEEHHRYYPPFSWLAGFTIAICQLIQFIAYGVLITMALLCSVPFLPIVLVSRLNNLVLWDNKPVVDDTKQTNDQIRKYLRSWLSNLLPEESLYETIDNFVGSRPDLAHDISTYGFKNIDPSWIKQFIIQTAGIVDDNMMVAIIKNFPATLIRPLPNGFLNQVASLFVRAIQLLLVVPTFSLTVIVYFYKILPILFLLMTLPPILGLAYYVNKFDLPYTVAKLLNIPLYAFDKVIKLDSSFSQVPVPKSYTSPSQLTTVVAQRTNTDARQQASAATDIKFIRTENIPIGPEDANYASFKR